jgi:hypothetical protein
LASNLAPLLLIKIAEAVEAIAAEAADLPTLGLEEACICAEEEWFETSSDHEREWSKRKTGFE